MIDIVCFFDVEELVVDLPDLFGVGLDDLFFFLEVLGELGDSAL
jgi:hypothetical protein